MNHELILSSVLLLAAGSAAAAAPEGYYDSLYGKTGAALKAAVKSVVQNHTVISYGDETWSAFQTTDVRDFGGTEIWFDMYSNVAQAVAQGHSSLNIEHSVANSWWGGKKGSLEAYSDLYLLNPSNSDANNRKSNWPIGDVGDETWTNGLSTMGAPVAGQGGGSATVFEPADEYKGDFARAFFYVFTVYSDIPWQADPAYMYDASSDLTLKPWAYEMLLRWAENDPVDTREAERNERIAALQGNRNPYIDMPGLARYVWGDRSGTEFTAADTAQVIVNRPPAPVFTDMEMPAVNTYAGRWWEGFTLSVSSDPGDLWISVDGSEFVRTEGAVEIPAADADGEQISVLAKTLDPATGLWSPAAALTLTARNPAAKDLKDASWRLVTSQEEVDDETYYILVSAKNYGVMNTKVSKTSSSWSLGSDWKASPADGVITGVTENTAVLALDEANSADAWYVEVCDIATNPLGYLSSTTAKKMQIAPEGSEVNITVTPDGTAVFDFGSKVGRIYYNASQPRFSTYTSTTMESVSLYALVEDSGVQVIDGIDVEVRVEGGRIVAPEGSRVYNLQGIPVGTDGGLRGAYIVVTAGGAVKVMI